MTVKFEEYGELRFIESEDFYAIKGASLYGSAVADDGDRYDIILIRRMDAPDELVCGFI